MSKTKKLLRLWAASALMALALLLLSFYWLSRPYIYGDEAFLIKWNSLIKKSFLGIDPKPDPADILFVDVAKSKAIISGQNDFGETSPHYREVISDRRELATFLRILRRYSPDVQLIVCDILMEHPSPMDSILQQEVDSLGERILLISHLDGGETLIRPVIKGPHAVATYRTTEDLFLKYPLLLSDTLKTIPLVMYEKLNQVEFRRWGPFYWLNRQLSFPNPVIDHKLRPADFPDASANSVSTFSHPDIGFFLEASGYMPEENLRELFQGKVVIIGDFSTDLHNTPFGLMPGALLIYNTYLTLAEHHNAITWGWIIFMLIAYYLIAYRIFTEKKFRWPRRLLRLFNSKVGKVILDGLDEAFILTVITIFSYFFFHIHINILFLLIFIKVVEYIWKRWRTRKKPEEIRTAPQNTNAESN